MALLADERGGGGDAIYTMQQKVLSSLVMLFPCFSIFINLRCIGMCFYGLYISTVTVLMLNTVNRLRIFFTLTHPSVGVVPSKQFVL